MNTHLVQQPPVRIYRTGQNIMLAAPMPGMEPQGISVNIAGERVAIRGQRRGPEDDWRELLVSEWSVGPYFREVNLPAAVSGALSNATYGNGILVLSMPIDTGGQEEPAEFSLEVIQAPRGERVGHTGHDSHTITTQGHRRLRELAAARQKRARKPGSKHAAIDTSSIRAES